MHGDASGDCGVTGSGNQHKVVKPSTVSNTCVVLGRIPLQLIASASSVKLPCELRCLASGRCKGQWNLIQWNLTQQLGHRKLGCRWTSHPDGVQKASSFQPLHTFSFRSWPNIHCYTKITKQQPRFATLGCCLAFNHCFLMFNPCPCQGNISSGKDER